MSLQEVYEQVLYCSGYEDVCRNCPYNRAGACNDIFDLMRIVVKALEEVLQNGMANN